MEIDKTLRVAAPVKRVWALLLDPVAMGTCVPGMKSIEVIGDDEYIALMHVKISFISANFKLRTQIVEKRPPHYLRSQGTGEDTAVASSLKQTSEVFLTELPDGTTELRIKVVADVLGRLGTFGLSVMKTKADRMWDEFGKNIELRLAPPGAAAVPGAPGAGLAAETALAPATAADPAQPSLVRTANTTLRPQVSAPGLPAQAAPRGWFKRVLAALLDEPPGQHIRIELQRGDTRVTVQWPVADAERCTTWLNSVVPK